MKITLIDLVIIDGRGCLFNSDDRLKKWNEYNLHREIDAFMRRMSDTFERKVFGPYAIDSGSFRLSDAIVRVEYRK